MVLKIFPGFRKQFGISATVWDFGNSLGFWQQFGIWDLGLSVKCRNYISAYVKSQINFGIYRFRHPSIFISISCLNCEQLLFGIKMDKRLYIKMTSFARHFTLVLFYVIDKNCICSVNITSIQAAFKQMLVLLQFIGMFVASMKTNCVCN